MQGLREPEPPYADRVNELVCLDMECGPEFVDRLSRAWDDGDAVFPLDQRLPARARNAVLSAIQPTIIATSLGDERVVGRPVENGDAVVVATSGTTGAPKGAVLTHDAVTASALASSARIGATRDDEWLACLPPSHVGGLSVITRALVTGTRLLTAPRFTPEACIDASHDGATLVSLVATALARIDPMLFRVIVLGGSRPPDRVPDNCVTTYGMTETGSGIVYDGVALDGVQLQIREGIIHVRGPMLMRAYRDGARPFDDAGWFRTGDIGSVDSEGRLHVEGREGDLIVTGGEKVWPESVEAALRTMADVADCCVAGVPDDEWGHAVHAWIVTPNPGALTLDSVRRHVKDVLPAYSAPRVLHIVDTIPRTSLGKARRSELVDRTTLAP